MTKKILIISPYFPPSNTADMQRVRMSLNYFGQFGWEPEVVAIDEKFTILAKDELLFESIPLNTKVHRVKALSNRWISKMGAGSLPLRSLWYYRKSVNRLLKNNSFNLIYFSTTQFAVCALGPYWKKRFGVPYVIDLQDPWHSDYYLDKPKSQRPPKFWFAYYLNKWLEPRAIKNADGLISVSEKYILDLKNRYPEIKNLPATVITFGSYQPDFKIALDHQTQFKALLAPGFKNIVYIGRGGADMNNAIIPVFRALKKGLENNLQEFKRLKFYFIGTSYSANGQGVPTIIPLAKKYGIEEQVVELTDRISFYHTLLTLTQANALFMPGSDDPAYTASKIYPYLLTKKPLLAIFNSKSPALGVLKEYNAGYAFSYDGTEALELKIGAFLQMALRDEFADQEYFEEAIVKYGAKNMTRLQCDFFNEVLSTQHE